jgi:hypothetical protein
MAVIFFFPPSRTPNHISRMVAIKGKTALVGICLFVWFCATAAFSQNDTGTRASAIAQAQQLQQLFVIESNPYVRVKYIKELSVILNRFGAKGSEQWLDDFLDKALHDSKAEVVIDGIRLIGTLQKNSFIDRLVTLYGTVAQSPVSLSSGPIRCEIIKVINQFPADPRVCALLKQIITDTMADPFAQEVRLAVAVMGQSGKKDFLSSLRSFANIVRAKKNSLEEKTENGKLSKEEQYACEYRISMYGSLLGHVEKIMQKLMDSRGGAQ